MVDHWKIAEYLTSSDHSGIFFQIYLQKPKLYEIQRTTRKYNTRKANWTLFHEKLGQLMLHNKLTVTEIEKICNSEQLESTINTLTNSITTVCDETIPKKKTKETLKLPWWSEDLAILKKQVATMKNKIRCAAEVRRPKVVEKYLKQKEKYELAATRAQIEGWKKFCGKQETEGIWEGIYRVIGRTGKREEDQPLEKDGKTLDPRGSVRLLAETFYPRDDEDNDRDEHRVMRTKAEKVNEIALDQRQDPPFTLTELQIAANSFNPKKAPGADGFTADICRHAIEHDADLFLAIINKCLTHHRFPDIWKEATVIVLRKPAKDSYKTPEAYRPIGLQPVLGKVLEKMVVARLRYHLIPTMITR